MSDTTTETRTAASVVDDSTAHLIQLADGILRAANAADGDHAVQVPGRAYGDGHTLLMNLLRGAYGEDADEVREQMVESDVNHVIAAAHIAHLNEQRAREAASAACPVVYPFGTDSGAACPACGGYMWGHLNAEPGHLAAVRNVVNHGRLDRLVQYAAVSLTA